MKKILLLSITLLTMLMADLTLEGEVLTITGAETTPSTSGTVNSYLEPIDIPAYNSGDPSHLLITVANAEWTSTNLNNPTYKHFYVEPGNYSATLITLTVDGTTDERRSISLYNGNNTHPATMTDAQQADIRIKFNNADYWDIDRMSFLSVDTQYDWLYNGASYNTFNRVHMKNFFYGIRILHQSNYNTVQNSYLNGMSSAGRLSDNVGLALTTGGQGDYTIIIDTKFINNDIKNCGDGIQLIAATGGNDGLDYRGTIIDSNRIWVDNTIYYTNKISDGGVLNPNGMWSLSENAIDFKGGSQDASNPIIISNNIMWGFRRNADDGDPGSVMGLMYGVQNITIENNIFADAERGLAINDNGTMSWAAKNITIQNNIFYKVNETGRTNNYSSYCYESDNITYKDNSYIDNVGADYGMIFMTNTGATTFNNNLLINADRIRKYSGELTSAGNHFYGDSINDLSGINSISNGIALNANMIDYTFKYDRFTASIKSKTLTSIITTESSPHYGLAGSSITQSDLQ